MLGSPPRMRGKPDTPADDTETDRITPADAGKTSPFFLRGILYRDHPRGCGENDVLSAEEKEREGSPPRMRGKLSPAPSRISTYRITPADAGKTRSGCTRQRAGQDHPRGCGENAVIGYALPATGGITPADAGKTKPRFRGFSGSQDHPRGCGENEDVDMHHVNANGSPPRMRGKLSSVSLPYRARRITPADAGKTITVHKAVKKILDHPRGCGENRLFFCLRPALRGSPPRMRGKPVPDD